MRGLVAVAVLVLLSGCLEQSAAPPVEADVAPDDEPGRTARQGRGDREDRTEEARDERGGNVTVRSFADQYAFTLTTAAAFITVSGLLGDYNCVAFQGAPFTILTGTATVTWASQSALTDTMDLRIRTYWNSDIYETYSGPSPLVVEFGDLEVEADPDFDEALTFSVDVSGPAGVGAAYEQDVTMDLAFDYESDIDVDPSFSYC
jgi:hypothetical protein